MRLLCIRFGLDNRQETCIILSQPNEATWIESNNTIFLWHKHPASFIQSALIVCAIVCWWARTKGRFLTHLKHLLGGGIDAIAKHSKRTNSSFNPHSAQYLSVLHVSCYEMEQHGLYVMNHTDHFITNVCAHECTTLPAIPTVCTIFKRVNCKVEQQQQKKKKHIHILWIILIWIICVVYVVFARIIHFKRCVWESHTLQQYNSNNSNSLTPKSKIETLLLCKQAFFVCSSSIPCKLWMFNYKHIIVAAIHHHAFMFFPSRF